MTDITSSWFSREPSISLKQSLSSSPFRAAILVAFGPFPVKRYGISHIRRVVVDANLKTRIAYNLKRIEFPSDSPHANLFSRFAPVSLLLWVGCCFAFPFSRGKISPFGQTSCVPLQSPFRPQPSNFRAGANGYRGKLLTHVDEPARIDRVASVTAMYSATHSLPVRLFIPRYLYPTGGLFQTWVVSRGCAGAPISSKATASPDKYVTANMNASD